MRHRKKFNHLGRKKGHRSSMLANMACSLIYHKRINTTLAKAKALKRFIEPLITKSKSDTTHNRRIVFSRIKQKNAISELFREISVKVADRPGGYTRVIRLGNRLGDNADMAMIELVDYNDVFSHEKKKKSTRRSRRGGKNTNESKTSNELAPAVEETSAAKEAPAVEETSAAKEAPIVEEVPAVEEAPAAEEVPAAEEAPAAEEVSAAKKAPAVEDSSSEKEKPSSK
jgi:large subunit ribosomal protein L17